MWQQQTQLPSIPTSHIQTRALAMSADTIQNHFSCADTLNSHISQLWDCRVEHAVIFQCTFPPMTGSWFPPRKSQMNRNPIMWLHIAIHMIIVKLVCSGQQNNSLHQEVIILCTEQHTCRKEITCIHRWVCSHPQQCWGMSVQPQDFCLIPLLPQQNFPSLTTLSIPFELPSKFYSSFILKLQPWISWS